MATKIKLSLQLKPVSRPWVKIKINGETKTDLQIAEPIVFDMAFDAENHAILEVEHYGKKDDDPSTAVIIENISFFGMSDPHFVWAGNYYPDYPEHYQNKKPKLPGQGYLGWNGVYRLEFDVPVFTWIHRTLNMGWLYD